MSNFQYLLLIFWGSDLLLALVFRDDFEPTCVVFACVPIVYLLEQWHNRLDRGSDWKVTALYVLNGLFILGSNTKTGRS